MLRHIYEEYLGRADNLIDNVIRHAPPPNSLTDDFRADLAGMLCVSCVAQYENCVKVIMVQHARAHHPTFGDFVERHYTKLNSKITRDDLEGYADVFDSKCSSNFKIIVDIAEKRISMRTRDSVKNSYANMLRWRHNFAHAGTRSSTLEEVRKSHLLAKRVIHCFARCLG